MCYNRMSEYIAQIGRGRAKQDLERLFRMARNGTRRGAPPRHSARFMVFAVLLRLRTALPLRLVARMLHMSHATLWRICNRGIRIMAEAFNMERSNSPQDELIVDTTSVRIGTRGKEWYSGHRKRHVAKVQMLCDARGVVRSVSEAYPGSRHDKTIWNGEFPNLPGCSRILGDRAYAGAKGEGTLLFRPVKRNETAWKTDPDAAKEANQTLSRRRVRIEHVFAKLKTWRIIHHYFPMKAASFAATFKAIALLNNISIRAK